MMLARRLPAALMALVLVLFPVALERCRTACVSGSPTAQASIGGHACHEAATDESITRLDPAARACGHGDEVRYESVSLAAGKARTIVVLAAITPLPGYLQAIAHPFSTAWSPHRSFVPGFVLPLDLPLRL
jgi:hypothetical protein